MHVAFSFIKFHAVVHIQILDVCITHTDIEIIFKFKYLIPLRNFWVMHDALWKNDLDISYISVIALFVIVREEQSSH